MQSANVSSLDTIRDFRVALLKFIDEAGAALDALRMELNRAVEWLQQDRPAYWQQQVQKGWTNVSEARVALEQCRLRTVAGQRPACHDERIALEKAKRNVQHAEEMIDIVRHWCQTMQHEVQEYEGRISHLESYTEIDLTKAVAALDRIIDSLEKYAAVPAASDVASESTASRTRPISENDEEDDQGNTSRDAGNE